MRLFNSGSKGVGAAEIIIGGAAGVFLEKTPSIVIVTQRIY